MADVVDKPPRAASARRRDRAPMAPAEQQAPRAAGAPAASPRWLLITSSKGGSGKTTTAYNLAVFAVNEGLRVGLLDLDAQGALSKWHALRPPEAPTLPHHWARMEQWREAMATIEAQGPLDLVIIDTPPAVEAYAEPLKHLLRRADLCLVPSRQGGVDTAVAAEHLRFLRREKVRAAAVLNQARANTRSFQPTRLQLAEAGALCPFEIRDLEDIRDTATLGLGVLEVSRYQGTEDYRGVWLYARGELGLGG